MNRRHLLTGAALLALSPGAFAAAAEPKNIAKPEGEFDVTPPDPTELLPLWPALPPNSPPDGLEALTERIAEKSENTNHFHDRLISHIAVPHLAVFRPAVPNGVALLIAPGGGYAFEAFDGEGYQIARHFNATGITCFVLRYRLPSEGWRDGRVVPLQDAMRSMRLIRYHARHFGIDPARLGVMGFSAGGHLAASLATRFDETVYDAIDTADAVAVRPDFACLMYPVITTGVGTHGGSRERLLGTHPTADMIAATSCEKQVSEKTPPCFIALAGDDTIVPPIENGVAMSIALQRAKVPSELHIFEEGGHGFCIRKTVGKPVSVWPELFTAWLGSREILRQV